MIPTVDSAPRARILRPMKATPTPCPLCRAEHPGPCHDATTDAEPLLVAGAARAGSIKALAPIIGYRNESVTRARSRAAKVAAETGEPACVVLPHAVRRALVQYLLGEPVTPARLGMGRQQRPAGELAGRTPTTSMFHAEMSPSMLRALDDLLDTTASADPGATPSRAGLLRTLLAEGLTARGYTWQTGEHDGRAIAPADAALVPRQQGWPRVSVSLPVALATTLDAAADAAGVSRQGMARTLVGEAMAARGASWRTGKRLAGR